MEGNSAYDLIRGQLRHLRIAAGMSQEDFGKLVHYSSSMVSAVELGQRPLDRQTLARADEVLKTGGLLVSLFKVAEREGQASWFRPWLDAEASAQQLRLFEPILVPGLLQTENYARTILRFNSSLSNDEVERQVAGRMERQKIISSDNPPQIFVVLDERVLRHTSEEFSGLMTEQVAHLITLAGLPHVHILIIPASAGLHIGASGPFALARSADKGWVGHMENQLGGDVVDKEDDVATLLTKWEGVRNEALPRRQSIELMKEVESHHGLQ